MGRIERSPPKRPPPALGCSHQHHRAPSAPTHMRAPTPCRQQPQGLAAPRGNYFLLTPRLRPPFHFKAVPPHPTQRYKKQPNDLRRFSQLQANGRSLNKAQTPPGRKKGPRRPNADTKSPGPTYIAVELSEGLHHVEAVHVHDGGVDGELGADGGVKETRLASDPRPVRQPSPALPAPPRIPAASPRPASPTPTPPPIRAPAPPPAQAPTRAQASRPTAAGYTLRRCPMSCSRLAACWRYESSLSGSRPARREGLRSNCSRLKYQRRAAPPPAEASMAIRARARTHARA